MGTYYSYSRVSSGRQTSGSGMDRQGESAEAWARARGVTLDDSLSLRDAGRSARSGDHLRRGALGQFLELATAGKLGQDPVLLVEAIDRLSRLGPLDGLADVLLALIRAGVSVITLEDGLEYSRDSLRGDGGRLVMLALKAQAAYEYSLRLSMRTSAAWSRAYQQLREGKRARVGNLLPSWLAWDGEAFTFTSFSRTMLELVSMLERQGVNATARDLNAARMLTASGHQWTGGSVAKAARLPSLWGAAQIGTRGEAEIVPDVFPPLIPRARAEAMLATMSARASKPATGPTHAARWIGQGITRCVCGAPCRVSSSTVAGRRYAYLKCQDHRQRFGCSRPAIRLELATAHLLTRLQPRQLLALVGKDDRADAVGAAAERVRLCEAAAHGAAKAERNAAKAVARAVTAGEVPDLLLGIHRDTVAAEQACQRDLARALAELHQMQTVPDAEALGGPVRELLGAFARGIDTPEQRRAVSQGLQRLGVLVLVDGERGHMALQIGSSVPDWQPVASAQVVALAEGRTSVRTRALGDDAVAVEDGDTVLLEFEGLA